VADEPTDFRATDGVERERPAYWPDLRVDPVEIALPRGVGYTLRAYRMSDEVAPSDVSGREDEFPHRERPAAAPDELDDDHDVAALDDAELAGDDEEHEEEVAAEPEEIPVFLGHEGRLYLFQTREGLVDFVRSDAPNDLAQLDTWSELVKLIQATEVEALEEDSYELDLVVDNLRGGPDAWDPALVIKAGEIARDIAYALRLEPVLAALSPGSPLDDLDEGLRALDSGGFASFFAKRRLRRIKEQQAALGWRTVIGKISAAVDWRE
jgi:hypothetical protein